MAEKELRVVGSRIIQTKGSSYSFGFGSGRGETYTVDQSPEEVYAKFNDPDAAALIEFTYRGEFVYISRHIQIEAIQLAYDIGTLSQVDDDPEVEQVGLGSPSAPDGALTEEMMRDMRPGPSKSQVDRHEDALPILRDENPMD